MNIKKILGDVPEDKSFFLHDGIRLRNLEDLREELRFMNNEEFLSYVNNEKNDFANWIEYVVGDKELADRLRMTKDKEKTFNLINSRLIFLRIKLENREENEIKEGKKEIHLLKKDIKKEGTETFGDIEKEKKDMLKEEKNEEQLTEELERRLRELEKQIELERQEDLEIEKKRTEEPTNIDEETKREEIFNRIKELNRKDNTQEINNKEENKQSTETKQKNVKGIKWLEILISLVLGFIIGMITARFV